MSEESISMFDLLNLSIGAPRMASVNFSALHKLLHAVLRHLGIRDMSVRWPETPPGRKRPSHPEAPALDAGDRLHWPQRDITDEEEPERTVSPRLGMGSRIQTCEDGVSKALKLIEELHEQRNHLKEEMEELRQEMAGAHSDSAVVVKNCCHRVDTLEENLKTVSDTLHHYPDPVELSGSVTWDVLESALLSQKEPSQQEILTPRSKPMSPLSNGSIPAVEPSFPQAKAVKMPEGILTSMVGAYSSSTPQQTRAAVSPPRETCSSERYSETLQALRNIGRLEARVAVLEEGQLDQDQLRHLISCRGSLDCCEDMIDEVHHHKAVMDSMRKEQEMKSELVDDVQKLIIRLQAECEKLDETSQCLLEDSRRKHAQIQELYKMAEELEDRKADKQMVETEIKADKSALDSKVSRLQFDSVTEQLSSMFHELLNKVTGQEQDWHQVVDRLSAEMELKLNRPELESVKKQLEDRWRTIQERLLSQAAPEYEDAAAIRKQLVDRFHCLSCDRPVIKQIPGPHMVTLPSSPGVPYHKSNRPHSVYAVEQLRYSRSERLAETGEGSPLSVWRSCGGSHTVTSASQRRTGLQHMKLHPQPEGDPTVQLEEVDIIGLDGHIYKGRLNVASVRHPDSKLPTISHREGTNKTKDRSRCSSAPRPPTSPEMLLQRPHSAKSGNSVSSSPAREWPGSVLGCTSHSSTTQDTQEKQTLHM